MNSKNLIKHINTALTDYIVWVLLIVIFLTGCFIEPSFSSTLNILNIFSHVVPMAMLVFGLSFLLMLGRLDLSMESTFALAPILANLIVLKWFPFLPPFLAIFICLGIGVLIGYINGYFSIKLGVSDFLVGLSMLLFLRGVVKFLIPEGLYGLPKSFMYLGSARVFGRHFSVSIFILIIVLGILYFITRYRPFGRKLLATGSNPEAAFIGGINTKKIQLTAFMISGFFAAFGGMLTAGRQLSCTNGMGEGNIMQALAAAVLGGVVLTGGRGSIVGALGGALLLQIIENLLTLSGVNPFLQDAVFGFILLAAILFQGIRTRAPKA